MPITFFNNKKNLENTVWKSNYKINIW